MLDVHRPDGVIKKDIPLKTWQQQWANPHFIKTEIKVYMTALTPHCKIPKDTD
jgi:hypothetical protein